MPPDAEWVRLTPDLEFMETNENKKKKSGGSGEKGVAALIATVDFVDR